MFTLYSSKWDLLFADSHNDTFRQKVAHQFTTPAKNSKNGEKDTNKPASIQRIPSPIPAKSPKEIKEISKYFKTTKPSQAKTNPGKSYTQASLAKGNTEEVLKIKEMFPTLKAKNIENIQKIIKGDGKPKPHINITTKGLSGKQIIIPMNDDNKKHL